MCARVWRLRLDYQGIDDSFYFNAPPTRGAALQAIAENQSIANSCFESWYTTLLDAVNEINFDQGPRNGPLCGTGHMLDNGVIFSISRYEVRDV